MNKFILLGLISFVAVQIQGISSTAVATTPIVINNWAGLLASSNPTSVNPGRVTKVSGTFVVPTLNLNSTNNSQVSIWLGMDGHLPFGSNTVEQIGITSQLINGQQQSFAWLEMYPYQPITLDINVDAGDTIEASVEYLENFTPNDTDNYSQYFPGYGQYITYAPYNAPSNYSNFYKFKFNNLSVQQSQTIFVNTSGSAWAPVNNQLVGAKRNSAEWVVEGYPGQFANFGTVTFSDIQVTFDNGNNITYNTANMSPSGPFLATAGPFANNSISINWSKS